VDEHPEELQEALDGAWIVWQEIQAEEQPRIIWSPGGDAQRRTPPSLPESLRQMKAISELAPAQFDKLHRPLWDFHPDRPYRLLAFCSVMIHFKVNVPLAHRRSESMVSQDRTANICDHEGRLCGFLYADVDPLPLDEKIVRFVLLSQCHQVDFPIGFLVSSRKSQETLFWVLLVEWMGDVFERRGIGQILQTSVSHCFPPGPRWQQIVLG
jgi:hypothetical protein